MVLIIGYGSRVRGDDAIGCLIAEALEQRLADADVVIRTQLTPELADPISAAEHVYFIDAAVGEQPGAVRIQPVEPEPAGSSFTHHVTPQWLVGAARDLYGRAPAAHLMTVAGGSFEFTADLSRDLQAQLPGLIDLIQRLIETPIRQTKGHDHA